ncbi:PQQ-dependent catabolism-associated CXXCW motif protein [Rhodovulum euryhalinum]|uniref:PQQ-dependent catabolism-associated CXXCW motif protein n=1 Tax=Rhodovulum euryhalinum TaxID=35805 RepID=A0A4R2KYB7_9RHOB|nr:PQQ-dependent catabolism-associated CXXCW motif protein [Rhodovulum euryhalinum]TCO71675.1 PQQ-dependent catabolism-associated CXXCW motif protein [Rhodovulum euryhalinum]
MIRVAVLALALGLPAAALAQVAEPDDFRMDDYRAPVPPTLAGATVVGPEAAHVLWQSGQVAFVDVLPRAPKPPNLPVGTIWRDKPRFSIPGAIWLPNVGYGAIAEVTHAYFRAGLDKATRGDLAHPVLFFCLEDCWMSWNAAKRALDYGYTTVYWFPEGTDGWAFLDYPLTQVEAEPGEPVAQ